MNYIDINKSSWNEKVNIHADSDFYDLEAFIKGKISLNQIELDLLGDVKGKNILHLQCHFGQDTLSLSRMGAKVTGIDFSDKAITKATELNNLLGLDATFINCDLYELPNFLDQKFDIVFTSYGTIGWLPDINKWANIVQTYLKPGGIFVFAEFHPVVWMYDNDFTHVAYSYFNDEPIIEDEDGTYADKNAEIKTKSITWNHGLAEVFTALKTQGLNIEIFQEFDYCPYNCLKDSEEFEKGKYFIKAFGKKVPLIYSLLAVK
jgi:ubiquinone/menaquinone biosynthesis C-methylase UbiE